MTPFERLRLAVALGHAAPAAELRLHTVDGVPQDAVQACLKPDPDLGVTVLVVTSPDARYRHHLDEYAAQAAAACYVEELRQCIGEPAVEPAVDRHRCVESSDQRRRDREVS